MPYFPPSPNKSPFLTDEGSFEGSPKQKEAEVIYDSPEVRMKGKRGVEVLRRVLKKQRARKPTMKRLQPEEAVYVGASPPPPCPKRQKTSTARSSSMMTKRPITYIGGMKDPVPPPPPKVISPPKRDVPPVGMAQRIRYKLGRKVQGLVSEYCRLKDEPTQREMAIHVKGGQTLRENRMGQIMREVENLKNDLMEDGFGKYLAEIPRPTNGHYLKSPIKAATLQWFQNEVVPKYSHEERSGITQQYSGGSMTRYRYGK